MQETGTPFKLIEWALEACLHLLV